VGEGYGPAAEAEAVSSPLRLIVLTLGAVFGVALVAGGDPGGWLLIALETGLFVMRWMQRSKG
jgi:hypothetical protein